MRKRLIDAMAVLVLFGVSPVLAAPPLDDRASLQGLLGSYAQAGGGVLQVDKAHQLDGPLFITGDNITIEGRGKLVNKPPYVGPLIVVGPATAGPVTLDHRPPSVLDGSASAGRAGVATGGTHSLLFANDALTLGCVAGSSVPGYYSDRDALTVETCVVVPTGIALPAWTALMGFGDGTQFGADPFNLCVADDPATWCFSYRLAGDVFQQVKFPVDPTIVNHLAWQWNGTLGRGSVWVNGKRAVKFVLPAGSRLRRQSGLTPFLIGAAAPFAPYRQPIANISVFGIKVSGGERYADADVQTLLTGAVLNDYARYFHEVFGDAPLIAYLPLDDPPASPTVRTAYANGQGVAFWVDATRAWKAPAFTRIAGLTLEGHLQPPIWIGDGMYFKLQGLKVRNAQNAVASLPTSAAMRYKLEISSCELSGYDAPLSLVNTIYSTTNVNILTSGGTCVRESNCRSRHQSMEVPPSSGYQDTFFEIHGGICRLTDIAVDDENGGPAGAYIRFYQGWGQPARLVVDGFEVSLGSAPLLELVGLGTGGGWTTTPVEAKNFSVFGFGVGQSPVVLRASGTDGFVGSFNRTGVPWGTVSGKTSVKLLP